ncbi:hypothetical protein [Vreelandella sp. GE22]
MKKATTMAMLSLLVGLFSVTAQAETIEELMSEARGLVSTGFDMSAYGSSSNSDEVAQCMAMMRDNQPQADDLRSRIAELPYSVSKSNLDMAAIDLNRCLSCVPDAVSSCEAANELLDTSEQYLQ